MDPGARGGLPGHLGDRVHVVGGEAVGLVEVEQQRPVLVQQVADLLQVQGVRVRAGQQDRAQAEAGSQAGGGVMAGLAWGQDRDG